MKLFFLSAIIITLTCNSLFAQDCEAIVLPEGTLIISEDTFLSCLGVSSHYLICSGATLTFHDNSCFNTFYLEDGSSLILDESSYGYSDVYAQENSDFDANNVYFSNLYFATGANIYDTASPSSPFYIHECSEMFFDYSLSGSCNEDDPYCDDILLPAETVIVSADTSISCAGVFTHFLICSGVSVEFTDNSCFNTFYLEPGANLTFTNPSYGYSTVYAQEDSYFDANNYYFSNLYFATGANIYDTASPSSPFYIHECSEMSFDYSLSGSCTSTNIEMSYLEQLKFYPNPVSSIIYFEMCLANIELELFNSTGSLVLQRKISNESALLDVSHLSQGIYLLKFSHKDKIRFEKLIIQ